VRKNDHGLTIIAVHIDNCTIVATTIALIEDVKVGMCKFIEISDLGELHWLLGIEVNSTLCRYNLNDCKPVSTPMKIHTKLSSAHSPSTTQEFTIMHDVPYHKAIGSLMWACLGTWLDIAFTVTTLSKFPQNPGPLHWEAAKHILRYLKGTKDLWLSYGRLKGELVGYADADGSMSEDRHTINGYTFILNESTISWSCKHQEIISLSTTESKYIAATHATKEALWLRSLLSQLFTPPDQPTTLFSNNQSAIALSKDHQYHAHTKHIDIRFHFI
jgi:hypothetical protein